MVDKCLTTRGQQFSVFWQQAGGNIHCSYEDYQSGKIILQVSVLMIELILDDTSYESCMT